MPGTSDRQNGHRAIIGVTRSGKTTLAKLLASGLRQRGKFIGVFDPVSPAGWECDLYSPDPVALLQWAQTHDSRHVGKPIYLFWEEWGSFVGRGTKAAAPFAWLGRTSRHLGQTQTVIAHRWQDVDPALRENVDVVYAFCSGSRSAALLAEDFNAPQLIESLPKKPRLFLEEVTRFADSRQYRISFVRGKPRMELVRSPVDRGRLV